MATPSFGPAQPIYDWFKPIFHILSGLGGLDQRLGPNPPQQNPYMLPNTDPDIVRAQQSFQQQPQGKQRVRQAAKRGK